MSKVVHKNQGILEFSQNLRIDIIEITRPFISLDGYIYFKSIKTEAIVYKRRKTRQQQQFLVMKSKLRNGQSILL